MNRWLSGQIAWPLTERACRRDTWRRLADLRASDALDRAQLEELQNRKLRKLLQHAATQSPFYTHRLAAAGIDAADASLVRNDLQRIPFLTRDQIREHRESLVASSTRDQLIPYATGGSSGEPLRLYIDRARAAADWAARWRAREWWGLQPGDVEVMLWGGPAHRTWKDGLKSLRDRCLNQHVLSAFDLSPATMRHYVDRLRALQPACVYGYASSLALLSRCACESTREEAPLGSPTLRAVFATGEVLTPADQAAITQAFGAPVVQEYGCRDGGLLGCACPEGNLHVPQENVIVELVDDQGRPVAEGQPGDVVITYLETFAMPIIRYRNGDVAVAGADPCPCGRASQYFRSVRGRKTDHIVCRRGETLTRMHALSLMYVIREVEGIRQFRIHQPNLDRLEVQVVAGPQFGADAEHRVISGLLERMGGGVEIALQRREAIPPLPSGKHVCVTSDVRDVDQSTGSVVSTPASTTLELAGARS